VKSSFLKQVYQNKDDQRFKKQKGRAMPGPWMLVRTRQILPT
jgi:hypothetical protein